MLTILIKITKTIVVIRSEYIFFAFLANLWHNCSMQYKIPIQIENEDTIIFDLSLRQMGIIIV